MSGDGGSYNKGDYDDSYDDYYDAGRIDRLGKQ